MNSESNDDLLNDLLSNAIVDDVQNVQQPTEPTGDDPANEDQTGTNPDNTNVSKTQTSVEPSTEDENKGDEGDEGDDYDLLADLGIEGVELSENTTFQELGEIIKEHIAKTTTTTAIEDQEVKDFLQFKQAGGTLEDFKAAPKRIDFLAYGEKLSDDEPQVMKNIVIQHLLEKGIDEDIAKATVDSYHDQGRLMDATKKVLENLDVANKKAYEDWKADVEKAEIDNKAAIETAVKEAKTLINNGVFAGVVLDKETSKEFSKFIFETGELNNSYEKATVEEQLLLDLIRFHKYDLSKITQKVKTAPSKARTIGMHLGKTGKNNTSTKADKITAPTSDALDAFFNLNK